jgi:hypothetical protein
MKKILGLITALLLVSPVVADDVAVSSSEHGVRTWVVVDGDIYYCAAGPAGEHPTCYKAEMKD